MIYCFVLLCIFIYIYIYTTIYNFILIYNIYCYHYWWWWWWWCWWWWSLSSAAFRLEHREDVEDDEVEMWDIVGPTRPPCFQCFHSLHQLDKTSVAPCSMDMMWKFSIDICPSCGSIEICYSKISFERFGYVLSDLVYDWCFHLMLAIRPKIVKRGACARASRHAYHCWIATTRWCPIVE